MIKSICFSAKSPLARTDSNSSSKQSDKAPASRVVASKKTDASSLFSDDSDDTITSPRQNKKGETQASNLSDEEKVEEKNVPAMYKTIRDVDDSPQKARKGLDSASMTSVSSKGSVKSKSKPDEKSVEGEQEARKVNGGPGKMIVPTVNVIASSEIDENSVSRKNSNSDISEFEAPKKKESKSSDSEENMKDWYNDSAALANAGLA